MGPPHLSRLSQWLPLDPLSTTVLDGYASDSDGRRAVHDPSLVNNIFIRLLAL